MVNAWLKEVHVMFDSDAKPLAVFEQLPPIMSNAYHLHRYVHEDEAKTCRYHPTTLEIKLQEAQDRIKELEEERKLLVSPVTQTHLLHAVDAALRSLGLRLADLPNP